MSTLYTGEKTNLRVLPQPSALESLPADNPGVGTKRGKDARSRATGVQHGRGETTNDSVVVGGVTPAPSGRVAGGVVPTTRKDVHPRVFVLDRRGNPLQPCRPDRARRLLKDGRARVHRVVPFVIRLVDRDVQSSVVDGVEVGIDPGSKTTGMAVFVTDRAGARQAVTLIELVHRGLAIKNALTSRAALRRGRRSRNLRYRAPRFNNRTRPKGWLAPSLAHRVITTTAWVDRIARWAPVTGLHVESVKFDLQIAKDPDITGVAYQQGTLFGYEIREYVLEKWGRACVYCDATGVPLNMDHLQPKSKGGSDRQSNLAPSCVPCNQRKDNVPLAVFLAHDPARLARITAQMKRPLRDAAAVNTTRWALVGALQARGYPVALASGGRTKWNRHQHVVPKTHALDALCVGETAGVSGWPVTRLDITCTGRGTYQRSMPDKFGFARAHRSRIKMHHGFVTGDLVRAVVPTGARKGTYTGRVAVKTRPYLTITTPPGPVGDIPARHIILIQCGDGYAYQTRATT